MRGEFTGGVYQRVVWLLRMTRPAPIGLRLLGSWLLLGLNVVLEQYLFESFRELEAHEVCRARVDDSSEDLALFGGPHTGGNRVVPTACACLG